MVAKFSPPRIVSNLCQVIKTTPGPVGCSEEWWKLISPQQAERHPLWTFACKKRGAFFKSSNTAAGRRARSMRVWSRRSTSDFYLNWKIPTIIFPRPPQASSTFACAAWCKSIYKNELALREKKSRLLCLWLCAANWLKRAQFYCRVVIGIGKNENQHIDPSISLSPLIYWSSNCWPSSLTLNWSNAVYVDE